ncbi:hypothetical protein CB1_000460024 [Camelus ferus]|nr:hypothetical protein CB1_000460024 [Camelus ferus]
MCAIGRGGNTGVLMGMFLVSFVALVALVPVLSGIGVGEHCGAGSGGVYSMIAAVLGGQTGGTIGLLYVFGQCVAGAMYITGFAESISDLLSLRNIWAVRGISVAVLLALLGINLAGVKWIIRLQLLLLLLLAVSTLDFVVGSFSHLDPGKCAVLSFKDFLSCRPTEIPENDILLCESRYNESDKQMKKFKGLKRFSLSAKVVDDEIYYFRKPIVPQKEPSPLLEKKIQLLEAKFAELEGGDDDIEEMGEEDSEVIEPPSLPQLQTPLASELDLMPYTPPQVKSTPKSAKGSAKKEGSKRKINMSGYILFSSEMRAVIKAQHPDYSFGELSRLVGTEWRNLETAKKAEYEERAAKVAEQQERERAAQQQQPSASPRAGTPVGALMGVVPPPTPMGMLNQQLTPVAGVMNQGVAPMVGTPAPGGSPYGQQVGVLGPPGQQAPPPYPGPHPTGPPVIQQPTTPMFVAPPPKTQRLLHSEAYLKYIEGLSAESNSISKWDQTLAARRRDVHLSKEQESRLPSHWLKSKGAHTTMADALWRLRDLMLRDTLNIRQAYNLENL